MAKYAYLFLLLFTPARIFAQSADPAYIQILGIAQDGGYPHMGCTKKCCNLAWENNAMKKQVVSLALIDPQTKKWWLFEATPDIKEQLHDFQNLTNGQYNYLPEGIFITHAHIGHYTGLMELGKEVMNTNNVPVYVLPKLKAFLETNGPWSQLVKLNNILLQPMTADSSLQLTENISIAAFLVPHRDEYSETAGFKINTGKKKYLFIPDINKWDKWDRSIIKEVRTADIALLDGTFYDAGELPGRNMSEIPHPFIVETLDLFKNTSSQTTSKIHFIHFNHTNRLLWDSQKQKDIQKAGFNIARQGEKL